MRTADMSMSQRMLGGFGIIIALLLLQLVIAQVLLHRIEARSDDQTQVIGPRAQFATNLRTSIKARALAVRSYALTREPERLAEAYQAREACLMALHRLEQLPEDPASKARYEAMQPLLGRYETEVQRFLAIVESRPGLERLAAAERSVAATRDEVLASVDAYADLLVEQDLAAREAISRSQVGISRVLLLLSALVIVAGALVGLATMNVVRTPARRLIKATRALAGGDYSLALDLRSLAQKRIPPHREQPRSELNELAIAFGQMAERLQGRERRLEADARIAGILAASMDVNILAREVLAEVAALTACEFGALYLADDNEEGCLRRVATFAAESAPAVLKVGDGIPGQAAAGRQMVVVRDIPADAPFRVRFGVDELPPRVILAAPILFGDATLGVLLLGSVRDMHEDAQRFVEQTTRALGISIQNALVHSRVVRLAEELQEKRQRLEAQNEELQAQGEELQAQSEELQAQNEELQSLTQQLGERNESLAEAARHKDEFLAMLGHELRNPLAAISHATHLLEHAVSTSGEITPLRVVLTRQTGHLARLVDDLLDVSRLTRGMVKLHKEQVDLCAVVQDAVDACRVLTDERQHHVSLELPQEPIWLDADPTRMGQVVGNLLANAAKYTEPGGMIAVVVGQEGNETVLRVRDNGVGIAPEMLPRVFDMFMQSEQSLDRSRGGLGIGLTMVRSLVQLHGGWVDAFSEGVGKGSEFVVRLPISATAPAIPPQGVTAQATRDTRASALRILVVDDNEDAAEMLATLLETWGHQVSVVCDGASAVDAVRRERPDVVLLDIGLPGKDGYAVAQDVRADAELRGIRLVAMTGYGEDEFRLRAEEAGLDEYLTKPVDMNVLRQLLADVPVGA